MAGFEPGSLWASVLVIARVMPVCMLAAALSRGLVPWPVALSLGLSLGVGLASGSPPVDASLSYGSLSWLVPRELCLGLAFGLAVLLPVLSLAWAARWAEQAFVPESFARSGPVSQLYGWLALVTFFALSGHRALVMGLSATLRDVPVGGALAPQPFALGVSAFLMDAFGFAVALSLPLLASMFIASATVALGARALGVTGSLSGPLRLPWFVLICALLMAPLSARVPEAVRTGLASAQRALRDMAR